MATLSGSGFFPALVNGFTMTIATELGDKTFMIAAVLAMRYNRLIVFFGAVMALLVMTVLSVAIGVAVPALLPRMYTHYAAGALFAYFGVKLLLEAREAVGTSGEHSELAEAEAELREGGLVGASATPQADRDEENGNGNGDAAGGGGTTAGGGVTSSRAASIASTSSGDNNNNNSNAVTEADPDSKTHAGKRAAAGAVDRVFSMTRDWPILTQAFTITFLAEWGDRSQIATIAMAAAQDPVGICIGSMTGHALCTGIAVVGGRLLAARISERTVALCGGILFILFALHSFITGPENVDA